MRISERLAAAEALLDREPERAFALLLDLYDDVYGTAEHDAGDAIELAAQAYASPALLVLVEARTASAPPARHAYFERLVRIVREELARRKNAS